ncbi:MAG: hypothetical protein Q4F88_01955, partial [Eubacteriales bacterium]|nr:hypothetical protein [Eubacteriales bacterium]
MPKDNKKTRILITGINSYIGNYFEIFIKENYREKFIITKISLRDDNWKDMDFSIYDCILH